MIPNNYKNKFVIFEGIDGSGKSEQFSRLQTFLIKFQPKLPVAYAKEPDFNRPTGKTIYEILKDQHPQYQLSKMQSYHMQAFYIEDRMCNYRENIIPGLQNGKHVIQDRGFTSSFCYGAKNSREFYDFMGLHDRVFSAAQVPFIWPDLILIFDVPAGVAMERMKKAGKVKDKFERKFKLELIRKNYLSFAKTYPNCVVIDGKPSLEEVFIQTEKQLLPLLGVGI